MNIRFWMRWSWRDLRARWLQVVAIGVIIAFGTGVFAGLGGQKTWRIRSNDLSYSRLNMHDLRIELTEGSYVERDAALAALEGIEGVAVVEARLILPTLVDASHEDGTVLVTGRIVGVDVSDGGPHVDSLHIEHGRSLATGESGEFAAVVEYKFAREYGLEPGDRIGISGDVTLDFVGTGYSPEYFLIIAENGNAFMAESAFAVIFMPLESVRRLLPEETTASFAVAEMPVNDLVVLLDAGADRSAVAAEISARMAQIFPDTGLTIVTKEDDPGYRQLYLDAENDQATWGLVALLFLIGAALGTFNLAGRLVQSQRRQIGIAMALGVPRHLIALRPILVGVQIAVLGTLFGLLFGVVLSHLFGRLFQTLLPLPYWEISLYWPGFLQGAALGILLPVAATLLPVWRAVRVAPIDAIKSGVLVAKGGGLYRIANHLALPGNSFTQMPVRNILRSPWRTTLTALGVAMAIVLLTLFIGLLDTFRATLKRGEQAVLHQGAGRVLVYLDFFYPVDSPRVTNLRHLTTGEGAPLFDRVETRLVTGGRLLDGQTAMDVMLGLQAMDSQIWTPQLLAGSLESAEPGLILSEKAADDLGVDVGDTVTLEHPFREGMLSFRLVETRLPVIGIHNNPMRALVYMDIAYAGLMGEGVDLLTNEIAAVPAEGTNVDDVKRILSRQPGVASVQPVAEITEVFDETLRIFTQVLRVIQGIVMAMAFLIAFNSTSINVDERVREIATMFAYGLPVRTVIRMQMIENAIIGVLGTLIGIAGGWALLNSLLAARIEQQLAEIKLLVQLSPGTLVSAFALGVLVVAFTPLFSIRRMARMDIPSTLRVME